MRNALLGVPVVDIDIAVPMPPRGSAGAAGSAKGIKVVETGLDHGTVTAIAGTHAFEVTSLRRDVETDGRHAKVAFTDDWAEDAARRDFTINALYASADGEIFDYATGVEDLIAGRVRFVGDAARPHRGRLSARAAPVPLPCLVRQGRDRRRRRCAPPPRPRTSSRPCRRSASPRNCCACWKRRNPAPVLRVMAATGILSAAAAGRAAIAAAGTADASWMPKISFRATRCCGWRRCCPMTSRRPMRWPMR